MFLTRPLISGSLNTELDYSRTMWLLEVLLKCFEFLVEWSDWPYSLRCSSIVLINLFVSWFKGKCWSEMIFDFVVIRWVRRTSLVASICSSATSCSIWFSWSLKVSSSS
jgi:hypothetical protein